MPAPGTPVDDVVFAADGGWHVARLGEPFFLANAERRADGLAAAGAAAGADVALARHDGNPGGVFW